jgi:hypothetical protein
MRFAMVFVSTFGIYWLIGVGGIRRIVRSWEGRP